MIQLIDKNRIIRFCFSIEGVPLQGMSNLAIEKIEENLFMGTPEKSGLKRVFGGQVLAQALMAAFQTASSRSCHSFHGYFLRPGLPEKTILYEVDRVRDGKSFATRRVAGIQGGLAIFNMLASFQKNEAGLNHQFDMPSVSGPDKLPTDEERLNRNKTIRGAGFYQAKKNASGPAYLAPVQSSAFGRG